jgi:signal transduction histidine kinase
LCSKLAGLIQGRIDFESEFGKGSRFTLLLPEMNTADPLPRQARA